MNEKILRKMFIIDKIMFSNCIYIIIHIYWNEKLSTFLGELSFSFKSFKSLKKYIIWFIFGLYLVYPFVSSEINRNFNILIYFSFILDQNNI